MKTKLLILVLAFANLPLAKIHIIGRVLDELSYDQDSVSVTVLSPMGLFRTSTNYNGIFKITEASSLQGQKVEPLPPDFFEESLRLSVAGSGPVSLRILDIKGRTIYSRHYGTVKPGRHVLHYKIPMAGRGIFLFKITADGASRIYKKLKGISLAPKTKPRAKALNKQAAPYAEIVLNKSGLKETRYPLSTLDTALGAIKIDEIEARPNRLRPCLEESFESGKLIKRIRKTYDEDWNVLFSERDDDGDGTPNDVSYRTWFAPGKALTSSWDNDGDGKMDRRTTNTYNAIGELLSTITDEGADGTLDRITTYSDGGRTKDYKEFKNGGTELRWHDIEQHNGYGQTISRFLDSNGDKKREKINRYTYDKWGNRLSFITYSEVDGDQYDSSFSKYDNQGRLLLKITFKNGGQSPVILRRNTYDARGNVIERYYEQKLDSLIRNRETFTYDEAGRLLIKENDVNNDGRYDERYTRAYDGQGRIILHTFDRNADGKPDAKRVYSYSGKECKEAGEAYSEADEKVIGRWVKVRDPQDRVILWEKDENADGVMEFRQITTFNRFGGVLTEETHHNGDGIFERFTQSTYDEWGNVLSYSMYKDGKSEPYYTKINTYSCGF